jgi:hypothetical protein
MYLESALRFGADKVDFVCLWDGGGGDGPGGTRHLMDAVRSRGAGRTGSTQLSCGVDRRGEASSPLENRHHWASVGSSPYGRLTVARRRVGSTLHRHCPMDEHDQPVTLVGNLHGPLVPLAGTSALASSRVRYVLRPVRSVLSDEKKLSIAALSQTLPDRLIEQTTPLSAMSRWNCSLVY